MSVTKQRRGKFRYRDTDRTQGRSPCDKIEIGVMCSLQRNTKDYQRPPGNWEEARKISPNLRSDCDLADTLIQISGQNCELIISIVLSHPVCDTLCYGSPRRLIHKSTVV